MPGTNTPKLDLLRIQETWQFGDEAFNNFIDDADNKLVGIAHIDSPKHWESWEKDTVYAKDDVIRITNGKSHQYYQCITGGTSGSTEPTNNVTGSIVTDGTVQWVVKSVSDAGTSGGTISIWLSGAYYNRGDAVLYGTSLYRCKIDHLANDWTTDNIYWQEVYSSIRLWQPNIYYFVDDSVLYDGLIYKCVTAHTSRATFDNTEEVKWEMVGGAGGANPWETNKLYFTGQFVIHDGILYRANSKHTSGATFDVDLVYWDAVNANIVSWTTNAYYPVGSLVQYGNVIYKSNSSHNSGSTDFESDRLNWDIFHIPSAFIYTWDVNTYYYSGQMVLYNNSLYKCNYSHVSDSTSFSNEENRWDIVYSSILLWSANNHYKSGSVVIYDGNIYRCNTSNSDSAFTPSKWSRLTGVKINDWVSGRNYDENDVVIRHGILYRAIQCIQVVLIS